MLDSRYDSGGAYLVPTVTVVRATFLYPRLFNIPCVG